MSNQDRPKSSWQSWVRSTEARRSSADRAAHRDDRSSPVPDADLDVDLAWGDEQPVEAGAGGEPALDSEEVVNGTAEAEAESAVGTDPDGAASSWTTGPDDGEVASMVESSDDDLEADDDGDAVSIERDGDGEGEYGELLPAVPLLPSIAGRVDALSGILRSISHRIDGLNAATDMYRSTLVDRIDAFTETVVEQGLRGEQALDEYRRTTERTIAELRRRMGEQGDVANRLLARVEELATDVAGLLAADPDAGVSELRSQLAGLATSADIAELREAVAGSGHADDPTARDTLTTLAGVESLLSTVPDEFIRVREEQRALAEAVADLDAAQRELTAGLPAIDSGFRDVGELLAIVIDTMPASAEGSAADVASALAGVESSLEALAESLAAPPRPGPAAAPPPAPAAVIDDAMAATIADAVVDRLDLDALALLVAEHLSATFQVVDDAAVAAADAPAPPPPKTGRRRKKG